MNTHKRPPAANPSGGLLCVRVRLGALAIASAVVVLLPAHQVGAQYIRGTIRAQGSEATVQGASITVLDSLDRQLLAVQSDNGGHFVLPLSTAIPFKVTVRKIGWQPSSTDLIHASVTDTLDMDLEVPVDGVALAGVEVNAAKSKSFNETAFENAKKLGWKIYGPGEIEQHRNEFSSFENMMRTLQVSGVKMPGRVDDCYLNLRNGRCFSFVVDGHAVGTNWVINPVDIYFLAILQASESSVQFGDKAPWGAILIVTRMNGDKKHP